MNDSVLKLSNFVSLVVLKLNLNIFGHIFTTVFFVFICTPQDFIMITSCIHISIHVHCGLLVLHKPSDVLQNGTFNTSWTFSDKFEGVKKSRNP